MPKLRVACFTVSLDGYGAGPDQSRAAPLGVGAELLHTWMLGTRTFKQMVLGQSGGSTGADDAFAARSFENVGAWILGRNMFAPSRGPWPENDPWKGWWGDNPPYHCDVFVLSHYARDPIPMAGGTTFHFVTDGIHAALEKARAAAKGRDVRIGGGAATIRQFLQARLVDEMHIAVSPILLGRGEPLLTGIDLLALGFRRSEHATTPDALHVVFTRG